MNELKAVVSVLQCAVEVCCLKESSYSFVREWIRYCPLEFPLVRLKKRRRIGS